VSEHKEHDIAKPFYVRVQRTVEKPNLNAMPALTVTKDSPMPSFFLRFSLRKFWYKRGLSKFLRSIVFEHENAQFF